jgi:hypothetical protein
VAEEQRLLPVPEGSGAARWDVDGKAILVVSDSGNAGAAILVTLADWATQPVVIPLGEGASDDVEGLSRAPADYPADIVGVTSSGWLREWTISSDSTLTLTRGPYALGEPPWSCTPTQVNCGKNYEGLCIHPAPAAGGCAGFAVSKATGVIVCLIETDDGYRVDPERTLAVVEQPDDIEPSNGWLSGCTFEAKPPHRLVVAGNLFTAMVGYHIDGYNDLETATVTTLPWHGPLNQEALVFADTATLISIGDTQGLGDGTSPFVRITCGR